VPGVAKVDFFGEQEEKVFIELSNSKLATLGCRAAQIIETLAKQNAVAGVGRVRYRHGPHLRATDRLRSTAWTRSATLRSAPTIASSGSGDIAKVTRGYVDPPQQKMRWAGKEALASASRW
jgi:multidrug efflux pump